MLVEKTWPESEGQRRFSYWRSPEASPQPQACLVLLLGAGSWRKAAECVRCRQRRFLPIHIITSSCLAAVKTSSSLFLYANQWWHSYLVVFSNPYHIWLPVGDYRRRQSVISPNYRSPLLKPTSRETALVLNFHFRPSSDHLQTITSPQQPPLMSTIAEVHTSPPWHLLF